MRIARILLSIAAALAAAAWLGLPPAFRSLGLHPERTGPVYELPGGRALIVTTSHATLSPGERATGVFASEMTAPYYVFEDGGMRVDVASIAGGEVPIDPLSFLWFVEASSDRRFRRDAQFQDKVKRSLKIDDVDFAAYDVVFLAGGWGAAYDLGASDVLGRKISEAWKAGRVVGGVCHGPLGLLKATDEAGAPLARGRRVSAVTDKQVRELGITVTPMHPERELRAAGAVFESATAFRDIFADHVARDGRLVTGQNQNAGPEVAAQMMAVAGARRRP
jgi:putative intracellular protease/amidase